jgi:hypothetical protein
MKTKIIILVPFFLAVGCSQNSSVNSNAPLPAVTGSSNGQVYMKAKAEFDLSSAPDGSAQFNLVKKSYAAAPNCLHGQCTDYTNITVTNSGSTQFQLVQSQSQISQNVTNQNLSNIVDLKIATLFDNNLTSCGGQKCTAAAIRIYTNDSTGVQGQGLYSSLIGKSVPLTVSGGSSNSALSAIPYFSAAGTPDDGTNLQIDLDPLATDKNVLSLAMADFADAASAGAGYTLSADFTQAGAGTYKAHVVVEYDLIGLSSPVVVPNPVILAQNFDFGQTQDTLDSDAEINQIYYFSYNGDAALGTHDGNQLWKFDSQLQQASMIVNINPGVTMASCSCVDVTNFNFFQIANNYTPFPTDSNSCNAACSASFPDDEVFGQGFEPGVAQDAFPVDLVVSGSKLFYNATVYNADGSTEQPMMVYDTIKPILIHSTLPTVDYCDSATTNPCMINVGANTTIPSALVGQPVEMYSINNKIIFLQYASISPVSIQLFTTDGTASGTTQLTNLDFNPQLYVDYIHNVIYLEAFNSGATATDYFYKLDPAQLIVNSEGLCSSGPNVNPCQITLTDGLTPLSINNESGNFIPYVSDDGKLFALNPAVSNGSSLLFYDMYNMTGGTASSGGLSFTKNTEGQTEMGMSLIGSNTYITAAVDSLDSNHNVPIVINFSQSFTALGACSTGVNNPCYLTGSAGQTLGLFGADTGSFNFNGNNYLALTSTDQPQNVKLYENAGISALLLSPASLFSSDPTNYLALGNEQMNSSGLYFTSLAGSSGSTLWMVNLLNQINAVQTSPNDNAFVVQTLNDDGHIYVTDVSQIPPVTTVY